MRSFFLLAVIFLLPGCGGPKLASVTGKVLHGGTGVSAGSIVLHPAAGNGWKGDPPRSILQLDGSFAIKSYPHGNGVPPGAWKATLSPALASRLKKPELGDPAKTPWTLEVPEGGVADKVFEVK